MRPFRRGDTLHRGGVLTLPASAWTGSVTLFDMRNPRAESDWGIAVTVTDRGANAKDVTRRDYFIELFASVATTARWPVRGALDVLDLQGRLLLRDGSGQVVSSARFGLKVET